MDDVPLNNSPDLTMEEITKQLFNNEFLSDIQFRVEGEVLFAHSWELIKRSLVFREQFRGNLGENKLIIVEDTTYKAFHEFLRFIYTDMFDTQEAIRIDLLKLAVKYKIVKLETKVLHMGCTTDTDLKYFDFSVVNNYELCHNFLLNYLIGILNSVVKLDGFLDIHSKSLEKILKSDRMPSSITELNLFDALVGWMKRSSAVNNVSPALRRSHFDKLIQLIRFPNMTTEEFRLCIKNNPDLLTNEDISTICQQITLGPQSTNQKWISAPRKGCVVPFQPTKCCVNSTWDTKFTVSTNLILYGLRYGYGSNQYKINISGMRRSSDFEDLCFDFEATGMDLELYGLRYFGNRRSSDVSKDLSFNFADSGALYNMISLGESIKLKPNIEYTIQNQFVNKVDQRIIIRKPGTSLIVTGPSNLVKFTKETDYLFEIFFRLPTD